MPESSDKGEKGTPSGFLVSPNETLGDIHQLTEVHSEHLANLGKQIEQLEIFASSYEALGSRLKTLPNKTSHEVMVPIGKLAFIPGQLVHTNEVLVLLGDNWFAERSAKQAVEIVARRIKDCNQKMEELQKIKKIHNNWLKEVSELKAEAMGDQVEIVEEITEEEYEAMKEKKRRANTAPQPGEAKKDLDKDAPQEWGTKCVDQKSFDDLLKRLDELEMEEQEKDELADMDMESEDEKLETESSDEEEKDEMAESENCNRDGKGNNKRRVSWVEGLVTSETDHTRKQEAISIYYTSSIKGVDSVLKNSGSHTKNVKEIQSPADIYEVFCSEKESSVPKPKGILKRSSYGSIDEDCKKEKDTNITEHQRPKKKAGWLESPQSVEIVTEYEEEPLPPSPPPPREIQSLEPAFSYKVVEHEARAVGCKSEAVDPPEEDQDRPRKVSRFKASRMKK